MHHITLLKLYAFLNNVALPREHLDLGFEKIANSFIYSDKINDIVTYSNFLYQKPSEVVPIGQKFILYVSLMFNINFLKTNIQFTEH